MVFLKRSLLLFCLSWCLAAPLAAQRAGPPGDGLRLPSELRLNDFWFLQRGAMYDGEWVTPERNLHFTTYPSWTTGALRLEGTRLFWRENRDFQMVLGNQLGLDLDSVMPPLAVQAARLDWELSPFQLTASAGTTTVQNLPNRYNALIPGTVAGIGFQSLGLATRLGADSSARMVWTRWENPLRQSQLLSMEFDPRWRGEWNLYGAYGLDLVDSGRRAYRWEVNYRRPWLQFTGQQLAQDIGYGPDHVENFNRGSNNLYLEARFPLTEELALTQSYRSFSTELPLFSNTLFRNQVSQWDTLAVWSPDPDWRLGAQYQIARNLSGSNLNILELYRGDLDWRIDRHWDLGLRVASQSARSDGALNGFDSDSIQFGGQLGFRPNLQNRAYVRASVTETDIAGVRSSFQELGGGYTRVLDDENGSLIGLDFSQTRFSGFTGLGQQVQTNLSLVTQTRPTPRLGLGASYSFLSNQFNGATSIWSVQADYVLDRHQQLTVRYGQNPFFQGLFSNFPNVDSTQLFSLELRQSWGGGLEQQLRERLAGQVRVRLEARAPDGDYYPLPGTSVALVGHSVAHADSAGEVRFSGLEAGRFRLEPQLDPSYVAEQAPEEFELEAGERKEQVLRFTAYAQLTLVAWNRQPGEASLPVGYVPVAGVRFRPDSATTDADGTVVLQRLRPGTYEVELDAESLPPGYQSAGPAKKTLELRPGESVVLDFPLVGRGRLEGSLVVEPAAANLAPVQLIVGGQRVARLAANRSFSVDVPAGRFLPVLNLADLGPDYYLEREPEEVRLQANSTLQLATPWVVHRYPKVTVQLEKEGSPLKRSGVPVQVEPGGQFLYTDERGRVQFTELKAGSYTFSIEPEHLPAGLHSTLPRRTVRLQPGAVETIRWNLSAR